MGISSSINNGISYANIATTGLVISAAASSLILYYSWSKSGCEKPFLPADIIRLEILTRLPVKSVSRFQCVCKSWKSLINSDPVFIKSHRAHNLIHPEDDGMIVHCRNLRAAYSRSEHPLLSTIEMKLSGSVNGLVCMYTRIFSSKTIGMIGIWNPFTRMYKDVVPPMTASIHRNNYSFTLGFDHVKNDYKVIFVSREDVRKPLVADVYSCNAGSWCNINVSSSFLSTCYSIDGIGSDEKVIYANGSIYWKDGKRYVHTFDIIDEVFKVFPDLDHHDDFSNHRMVLVNLRNSLAQIVHSTKHVITCVDVYVLNQKLSIWSKLYRLGPIILPLAMTSLGCFSITGNIVFNDQHNLKLLCIDEEKQAILKIKNMRSLDPSIYCFREPGYGFAYTRTLAFVKGMKPINLECARTIIIGCNGDIVFPSVINYD